MRRQRNGTRGAIQPQSTTESEQTTERKRNVVHLKQAFLYIRGFKEGSVAKRGGGGR